MMAVPDADFEAMVVSSYGEYVQIIRTFSSHEAIVREFEWRAMCLAAVATSRWLDRPQRTSD